MARGVAVLAHNQDLSARASTHVKREVAVLLVLRLYAEQLSPRCIRLLPPGSPSLKAPQPENTCVYIPEHMPPAEVDDCKFQVPQSDGWKNEHLLPQTVMNVAARREAHEWAAESVPRRMAEMKQKRRSAVRSESVKSFFELPKILGQVQAPVKQP